jgi:hypothetical protein
MAKNLAQDMEFWVAAERTQTNNWVWVAGPEYGTAITDVFWGLQQPNTDLFRDALYQHQGNWYAAAKDQVKYAIIEFECPLRPSPDGYCARMSRTRSYRFLASDVFTLTAAFFQGHYYLLHVVRASYEDAVDRASERNHNELRGHVATITTQAEASFIASTFVNPTFWISASHSMQMDKWIWTSGPETGLAINTKFWATGMPNMTSSDNCALSMPDGWHDQDCDILHMSVIEFECQTATSSSCPGVSCLDTLSNVVWIVMTWFHSHGVWRASVPDFLSQKKLRECHWGCGKNHGLEHVWLPRCHFVFRGVRIHRQATGSA